jgi:hypothetical protein
VPALTANRAAYLKQFTPTDSTQPIAMGPQGLWNLHQVDGGFGLDNEEGVGILAA